MSLTAFPVAPMVRVADARDVGRALRLAGRMGRQASLSGARLRDLAEVVAAMTMSLVLDGSGGWISVRALNDLCAPGIEVVAFDARQDAAHEDGSTGPVDPRRPLRVDRVEGLAALGSTPTGGTAMWARISDPGPVQPSSGTVVLSGLMEAAPRGSRAHSGWTVGAHGPRIRVVVCELDDDRGRAVPAASELLRQTHADPAPAPLDGFVDNFVRTLGGPTGLGLAVVDVDLAGGTVSASTTGTVDLRIAFDGTDVHTDRADPASSYRLQQSFRRSLSVVARTSGIDAGAEASLPDRLPPPLVCAALMRDHRGTAPSASVVALRVDGRPTAPAGGQPAVIDSTSPA